MRRRNSFAYISFPSRWPAIAYSNSESFPLRHSQVRSTVQVWLGLQLGRKTFPIQPRYFQPVCTGWMKAFLIPVRMPPLIMFFIWVQSESCMETTWQYSSLSGTLDSQDTTCFQNYYSLIMKKLKDTSTWRSFLFDIFLSR